MGGHDARMKIARCLLLATLILTGHFVRSAPGVDGGIQPRLSSDGSRMAMSYQGAIVIWDTKFSRHRVLFRTQNEGFDIQPAWSRDGKRLAYINTANFRQGQLRFVMLNTKKSRDVDTPVQAQGRLYFDSAGNRILGRFAKTGFPTTLGWYNLQTDTLTPLAITGIDRAKLNSWSLAYALSPDGRHIALATNLDVRGEQGGNNGPMNDLWLVPAAGGSAKKLTQFPARIYGMEWEPNPKSNGRPENDSILVVTDLGTPHNDISCVPIANPDRGRRQLTQGQADEFAPTAHGPQHLFYTDNADGAARTVVPIAVPSYPAPQFDQSINLNIIDAESGAPLAARVSVKRQGGKFHAPAGAEYRINAGRMHFYSAGTSRVPAPAGEFEIIATRGPEYRPVRVTVTLGKDSKPVALKLQRWTHPAKRGWFSGENHIHANYGYGEWHVTPKEMFLMAQGEGLNVGNIMVANSDGDAVFDRRYFRGRPDRHSTKDTILFWNQEYRSTIWGHMTFIHLEQLVEPIFTGFAHTTNPFDTPTNADSAAAARIRKGVVSYTHPASNRNDPYATAYAAKGLPVDAALGRIDTLDVMGFGYEASVPLWYRLLNCGFRIGAAAGTDCFLNRISSWPPGWGRAYVHCPGGFNYAAWAAGQKAGRSFVSTGPMLELTVDGKRIGSTLRLAKAGRVKVQAKANAQFPLNKVELIVNGQVVQTLKLADDKLSAKLDGPLDLKTTGWIALRASGPAAPPLAPRGLWAHTSPVYVEIPDELPDARGDAAYFLKWIDRLEADLKKRNRIPGPLSQHVQAQLTQARAVYRAIESGD